MKHGKPTKPTKEWCEIKRITNKLSEERMTRTEHLQWCKQRALEYVDANDFPQAFASMASDLGKHPETANHPAIRLGAMLMFSGNLRTVDEMRKFIEGFN